MALSTLQVSINGNTLTDVTSGLATDLTLNMVSHVTNGCQPILNHMLINATNAGVVKSCVKYVGYNMHNLILGRLETASDTMSVSASTRLRDIITRGFVGIYSPIKKKGDGTTDVMPMLFSDNGTDSVLTSILNLDYLHFGIAAKVTGAVDYSYFFPLTISSTYTKIPNLQTWNAYSNVGSGVGEITPKAAIPTNLAFYSFELDMGDETLSALIDEVTAGDSLSFYLVAYVGAEEYAAGTRTPDDVSIIRPYTPNSATSATALYPVTVNTDVISVSNSTANNADQYDGNDVVGYGWVGDFSVSDASDKKITITVTAGVI